MGAQLWERVFRVISGDAIGISVVAKEWWAT
jgi:hypothetical protein